jgi:hypothetical protein
MIKDALELIRYYQRAKRELQARGYTFEQVAIALITMLKNEGNLN